MTTNERFDDRLAGWLREEAQYRIPDHLDEVLVRTVATPQRSRWSSLERWLPMSTTFRGRMAVAPSVLWLVVIAGLLAAIVGGALATGAIRLPSEPTLGLATNGRLLVADGSQIVTYAPDGSDRQVLTSLPTAASSPWISPDGRHAATITGVGLDVIDLSDGSTTAIPLGDSIQGVGGPVTWSPDGSRMLFNTFDGSFEHLVTAAPDGTDVREIAMDVEGVPGAIARGADEHIELWPSGWSPTGEQIAFVAVELNGSQGSLYVVRPDGTDLRRVGPVRVDNYSVSWSPDPAVERLVFSVMQGGGLAVQVLDVATDEITDVGSGFWPTWSPDGSKLSYWHDGTVVVDTAAALAGTPEPVHVTPTFTTNCPDNANLAGQSFCGPARWSPDGTRLYGADIVGRSVVSVMADGSGQAIVIPFESSSTAADFPADWQPIRP